MSKKEVAKIGIIFLILMILVYGSECFFTLSSFNVMFLPANIMVFLLEVSFFLALFVFFIGIFKNSFRSTIVLFFCSTLFFVVNQVKIGYTNEPVSFYDFIFLKTPWELANFMSGTFLGILCSFLFKFLILLILIVLSILVIKKYNFELKQVKTRVICSFVALFYLVIMLNPSIGIRNFVLKKIYKIDVKKESCINVGEKNYNNKYGMIAGIYGELLRDYIVEPDGYDKNKIEEVVNIEKKGDTKFGKPNVIVYFAESFFDVDKLDEVEFDKEVTPNIKKLREKGISFDMISPSYGGVTANVEFEFLTGATLDYFNKGYVPYLQLYKDGYSYNRPSIIKELNNNGYKTKIHAYTSNKLFECGRFYNYVQFDETIFKEEVEDKYLKGRYVSDKYVVDKIIDEFENKDDENLFIMSLTMQSHMPFLKDKYSEYDISISNSKLSKEQEDVLRSYAQGVHDADKELARLYEYINTLDEPTIIVFFGDHLPYLQTKDGDNFITKLDYFNTSDKLLNEYRLYNTEALILANFDISEENYKVLSPDLLGAYVLNRMDIDLSNYYKWLYTLLDNYPASNIFVSMDKDKNLYRTSNLPSKLKNIYELRRNIQYRYFLDKNIIKNTKV